MTKLYGGLCCVAFALTFVAHLAGQEPHLEAKTSEGGGAYCQLAESDQAAQLRREKAVELIAVTSATCPPCKKLKTETLPTLAEEGYNVGSVNFRRWTGPKVKRVPTLFYKDKDGNIISSMTEVGFRTPAQIKRKLQKP